MKPGTEPEIRLQEIIKKLKILNPDIIGLQEINETLSDVSTNQAKIIADSLTQYFGIAYNYYYSFTHLSWNNQYREYVGIISKYPVINSGYKSLPQGTFPRKVVWNYIDTPIGKINFFSTHLSYSSESVRNQQVEVIIPYINEQESNYEGIASILVGDFNAIPTDTPIQKLTRNGTESFYYDTYHQIHLYGDPGYTVPSNEPNSRIDYIFLKNNTKLKIEDSYVTMKETYSPGKYCSDHFGVITILKGNTVGVMRASNRIIKFSLAQNYPNPFNPTTTIKYSIPNVGSGNAPTVRLLVYDILGREIAALVNQRQQPGNYSVKFDASGLTSGMYIYRLTSGSYSKSLKLMLMK